MSVKRISSYKVTLTRQQAYTLLRLLQHIGGEPTGPRGGMDKLARELRSFSGDFEDEPVIKFIDPYDDENAYRSPSIYIEKGQ